MNTSLNATEVTGDTPWFSYITIENGQAILQTTVKTIKNLDVTNPEELAKITAVLAASTSISVVSAVKISNNLFTLGQVSTGEKVVKVAKIGFWTGALALSSYISLATVKTLFNQL